MLSGKDTSGQTRWQDKHSSDKLMSVFRPVTCTDEAILVGIKTSEPLQILTPAVSMRFNNP